MGWSPRRSKGQYFATQLRAIPVYLRLLAWPSGQCADWYFPPSEGFLDPAAVAGGAFLSVLAAGALWLAARARGTPGDGAAASRLVGFGVPFFLVVLSPSSSVVPLLDPLAEHRVYLAALGLFVAAAAAVARNRVWTGQLALYQDALRTSPLKARLQSNLGQALVHLQLARDLSGDGTVGPIMATRNLVIALVSTGRAAEAREEVTRLLSTSPQSSTALGLLALVEYVGRRDAEAEAAALSALALDRRELVALKCLGLLRMQRGDARGALEPLREAAALNQRDPVVLLELGRAEERLGDRAGACSAWARAAELPLARGSSAEAARALGRLECR